MSKPIRDLRYGLQKLLKPPNYTLIAVFTLALGVSANKPNLAQADQELWLLSFSLRKSMSLSRIHRSPG
jgi:hypothetical protein